jgi:disulfide bond formation protein DsbB
MHRQKLNKYLIFILFAILTSLASAFVIEYSLGHKPCNLCVYERVPYIVSIFLILEMLFVKKYLKTILLLLFFIFILSSILAFYHFGVEQGFFKESFVCENKKLSEEISKEQLLEELKQSAISCKDVSFRVLGLSLAAINTIFSFALSVILIKLYINYEKN